MKKLTNRDASAVVAYIMKLEYKLDKYELRYPPKGKIIEEAIQKLVQETLYNT